MSKYMIPTTMAAFAAAATPGLADTGNGFSHMWGAGYGMTGGLMMVLIWGVIIGIIVLAVRGLSGRSSTGNTPTAQDILRDRYARGEIDEDEFERRKAKLDM